MGLKELLQKLKNKIMFMSFSKMKMVKQKNRYPFQNLGPLIELIKNDI